MNHSQTKNLVGTALCIALGLILPQVFHLIGAGPVFLPMHIPVLLCGLCFGWPFGLICGVVTPLLSSVMTGMPPLFPTGTAMVFELAAYGALSGLLYRKFRQNIYLSLIAAMFGGRVVSGLASAIFYGVAGKAYGLQIFLTGAFVTGLPGIILQILIVPVLVIVLEKSRVISSPGLMKV
ncbi:MAG: ECF transporter S component [Eubacterium limosum]|nr:ECF transporter S component [Eubacterium limosum]